MKRWKLIATGLVVIVVGWVVVALLLRSSEPSWHGKTLTEWLDDFHHEKYGSLLHYEGEHRTAIEAMGTNALPFLFKRLKARDGALKAKAIDLVNKQKVFRAHLKTAEENHFNAWVGFVFLGTNGLPAVPKLIKLTLDTDTDVRFYAEECCLELGYPDQGPVLAALENCLKDSDADIRRGAEEFIKRWFHREAERLGVYERFPDLKPPAGSGGPTNWPATK